jgi:hypothetical protein
MNGTRNLGLIKAVSTNTSLVATAIVASRSVPNRYLPRSLPYTQYKCDANSKPSDHTTVSCLADTLHLRLRHHILRRLIRELQIFFKRDRVFDLPQHNRRSDQQANRRQHPVRDEQTHVSHFHTVKAPSDSCSGGLYASGKYRQLWKFREYAAHEAHL